MDKKVIGITSLLVLLGGLSGALLMSLANGTAYYCESKANWSDCNHLSSTLRTCYPTSVNTGGKLCAVPWIKIVDDRVNETNYSGLNKCCGTTCWVQEEPCPKNCEEGGCR